MGLYVWRRPRYEQGRYGLPRIGTGRVRQLRVHASLFFEPIDL
jgi:hypothetical protein